MIVPASEVVFASSAAICHSLPGTSVCLVSCWFVPVPVEVDARLLALAEARNT